MARSNRFPAAILAAALLMCAGSSMLAQNTLPNYLSYQGVLTDANRVAVPNGVYTIIFKIYNQSQGGTPLWQETQQVSTMDGVFDAYLGLNQPLKLAFDRQYWVAAQLTGGVEMDPRTPLVPAPYAFNAGHAYVADSLAGGAVTSLNGLTGNVQLQGGNGVTIEQNGNQVTITSDGGMPELAPGDIWFGDRNSQATTLPIGTPNQVMTVNAAGSEPKWSSDITVTTLRAQTGIVDSLYVTTGARIDGPATFNDSAIFNGPVIFNFPFAGTDKLTNGAMFVGNSSNRISELLSTNVAGAILQQDGNGQPTWSNNLTINNLTVNGTTNITGNVTNIGSPTSTTTFDGDVIFNRTPKIALPFGNIWTGGVDGFQKPMAPGLNGQVLMSNGAAPSWQTVNLLPNGTVQNATLVWSNGQWVQNPRVQMDPTTGLTTMNGDLRVNGNDVQLPAQSIDNFELANSTFNITYGPGVEGSSMVALGSTMTIRNTGVVAVSGTPNQVNATTNNGTVTLSTPQNIDQSATPTFSNVTLTNMAGSSSATEVVVSNNGTLQTRPISSLGLLPNGGSVGAPLVWNGTTWISSPNMTVNPTTGNTSISGDLTVTGTNVNLPGGSISNFELENSSFNVVYGGDLTGDATVNLGGTLNIRSTGQNIPAGTATNSTLRWNGTAWVENTNLTSDAAGNTTVGGGLTVSGSLSGGGAGKYAGTVSIPVNAYQVSVSYPGIKSGASVNAQVVDNNAGVGIVGTRITSITPGVGFTVQLSITYDSPTGAIHYVVVNP